jgi:glycine/D-amino acid oxidase-like deaminating enzyme
VAGLVRSEEGRVTGVRLEDGSELSAGRVALGTGVWGVPFMKSQGLSLPLRPAKRYLYHTRPVEGLDVHDWPMVIHPSGAHCRPSEGNTLMMAWEHRPDPMETEPTSADLWEEQDEIAPGFGLGAEEYALQILMELAELVPVFSEAVGLARATCGWYAVTPDHKAILGEDPRAPGLYHATGFSGHGIMHGAATGRILADLLLESADPLVPPDEIASGFGIAPLLEGRLREPVEDMVL